MKKNLMVLLAALCVLGCTKSSNTVKPSQHQQLANQASQAMESKDYVKARSLFEAAVRSKPDFAEAWVGLGFTCVHMTDFSAAQKSYEQALKLHEQRYQKNPKYSSQLLQQVFVLFC